MDRFNNDGRLIIPITERKKAAPEKEKKIRYVVNEAYCPKGCNILDTTNPINGYSSLRIKFKRAGMEGVLLISTVEGVFDKIIESGSLEDESVKDELFCPHCDTPFEKLVNCNCQPNADMVVIGLTPELDFNNAITFCNVTGCNNESFVQSGHAIRHVRLNDKY